MASRKLRDFINTSVFGIIDDWTHQYIERLHKADAIAKYGDCNVEASYTSGFAEDGGFITDVWVEIPGMHLSNMAHHRITIPGGDTNEAEFIGRKSGCLITVTRIDKDDYVAWWRDESERDNETAGCSVRGTAHDIVNELEGEI